MSASISFRFSSRYLPELRISVATTGESRLHGGGDSDVHARGVSGGVTYSEAGTLWHVTLLGLTTPFDANLDLAVPPPPDDFGHMYDDRYVETVVRSHRGRVHPDSASFQLGWRTYGTRVANTTRPWRVCSRATFSLALSPPR